MDNKEVVEAMYDMLLDLTSKVNNIESKLDKIMTKQNEINKSTARMDSHIGFVEQTYSSLKAPLQFVKDKVSFLTGNQKENLPSIEDKN